MKYIHTNKSYSLAAEIHYRLEQHVYDKEQKEELLQSALIYFSQALNHSDGQKVPDTHYKLAECLKVKGDLQSAVASYQRTYEMLTHDVTGFMKTVARHLLYTMLLHYRNMDIHGTYHVHIAYWLVTILSCEHFSDDNLQGNSG